jgi:hypothetical protein
MSTLADVLPYMQSWLDARAAQATVLTDYNAARAALATARQAVTARVAAGDNAVQMTAVLTTYIAAKVAFVQKDPIQITAVALTAARFQQFEQMVELLAAGQDVPPFVAGP